jgi:hypothetical protein
MLVFKIVKHLTLLFLLLLPFSLSAKTVTDTITNWQVYKDGKLLLKNHEGNAKVVTITLSKSDDFKELKIKINQDTHRKNIRRKLMYKIDGKVRMTDIRQLRSSEDPIIISKDELLRFVGPQTNTTFTIEFTDDTSSKGTALLKLVVKE